jgi:hypothetical protein
MIGRRELMVALSLALAVPGARAEVLCRKKSGVLILRDACKAKETAVEPTQFGAVGPAGVKGDKGDKGDQGDPGPAATLPPAVPSGGTVRGFFGGGRDATTGEVVATSISYPLPLAANVTAIVVPPGGPVPTGCSGSVAAPGAAAGKLCLFFGFASSACGTFGTYGSDGMETYTHGAVVFTSADQNDVCEFAGTWAATVP